MKKFLALTMILSSVSVFASMEVDSRPFEKTVFCNAIDKALEEDQADMAVDMKGCLKAKMRTVGMEIGGSVIRGVVPFRSPNRDFTLKCSATLSGKTVVSKTIKCI